MPCDVRSPKVQLRHATPEDVEACGRIFYEAFSGVNNQHGVPPEIPTVESAIGILTMLFSHPGSMVRRSKLHRRPPLGRAVRSRRSSLVRYHHIPLGKEQLDVQRVENETRQPGRSQLESDDDSEFQPCLP